MSGSSALILAAYHPGQFAYAGSLSGFLNLSADYWPVLVRWPWPTPAASNALDMWGPFGGLAWQRNDPTVQVGRLVSNGTRVWVTAATATRPTWTPAGQRRQIPAQFLEGLTTRSNQAFQQRYQSAGGRNGVFNFRRTAPTAGATGALNRRR